MARTPNQRRRDDREYRRNQKALLADKPRTCALCFGRLGDLLYKDDLPDMKRWWLHPLAATADHIVPVHEGGSNALVNLRPAHRSCNSKRNKMRSSHELPRNVRDFGKVNTQVYGPPGQAAPHSF